VSNRRIAKLLGVSAETINKDAKNLAPENQKAKNNKGKKDEPANNLALTDRVPGGANAPSGTAAAKAVASVEARELKEQKREASRAENREKVAHVATDNIPVDASCLRVKFDRRAAVEMTQKILRD
jgi:hypothetical protein